MGPLSQEMEVAWRNLVRPQTGLPGPRDIRLIFQHLHALTISYILKLLIYFDLTYLISLYLNIWKQSFLIQDFYLK